MRRATEEQGGAESSSFGSGERPQTDGEGLSTCREDVPIHINESTVGCEAL